MTSSTPQVHPFFDPITATFSYVLFEHDGGACAVIDAVLDYDPHAARVTTTSADRIVEFVLAHRLRVEWLLETHVHADHLSGAKYLQRTLGTGRIAMGRSIVQVQAQFERWFGQGPKATAGTSAFDHQFDLDETFAVGGLRLRALAVPGHTPADTAYLVLDGQGRPELVFVGDTLFMPDVGTARCDFPGGDARSLYRSARRLLALPPTVKLFMCHDYPPDSRAPQWQTSVAEQRQFNIHVRDGISEDAFVAMREQRDRQLDVPRLILPALQVNLQAGELPPVQDNGMRYLRIPLNVL